MSVRIKLYSMSDLEDFEHPSVTDKPRKRKVIGRKRELAKKKKLSSHVVGDDCKCKRFQCFKKVSPEERDNLVLQFNMDYKSKDEQDSYLSSMIKPTPVKRHRPRKEDSSELKDFSFNYEIKVTRADGVKMIPVCKKAFISLFGITNRRVQTINTALSTTGKHCECVLFPLFC